MHQHGGKRIGKNYGASVCAAKVNETVGRLCPFQRDVRAPVRMESDEAADKMSAFGFEYSYGYVASGIAQLLDASSGNACEGILATDDDTRNAFSTSMSAQGGVLP